MGTIINVAAIILGTLMGELLNIEDKFEHFGDYSILVTKAILAIIMAFLPIRL